jgi:hypothetical protein
LLFVREKVEDERLEALTDGGLNTTSFNPDPNFEVASAAATTRHTERGLCEIGWEAAASAPTRLAGSRLNQREL